MELADCNFSAVVRTHDERLGAAIDAASGMILFGGHGGGIAPPGGPVPEVDTWSIYLKADTELEARRAIEETIDGLDVAVLVSIEPFEFSE
jgi:hypothetical protein